jgi:hypothetical protein
MPNGVNIIITQPFPAFLLLVVDNNETKGSPAEIKEETWTNYRKNP